MNVETKIQSISSSTKSPILIIVISLSVILAVTGLSITFLDLENLKFESSVQLNNASYVSALLSFSGVLLFVASLISQREEYKLQLKEFEKSAEAQQKTSVELGEQKALLIKQNTQTQIFQVIELFNNFKSMNGIYNVLQKIAPKYQDLMFNSWEEINISENSKTDKNVEFAHQVKNIVSTILTSEVHYPLIRKYNFIVYNLLQFIDENDTIINERFFKSLLFSQLNDKESIFISLANLIDSPGEPVYNNFDWGYYKTMELIKFFKTANPNSNSFSEIDPLILTTEFQKLKQSL